MSNISTELLAEKLSDWTLSSKVQDTLGLSSMDEDSFKKEFSALEAKGFIVRDGVRRGLKFKVSDTIKTGKIEVSTEEAEPVKIVVKDPAIKKVKKHHSPTAVDAKDIEAEVTIFPRHEYMDEVTKASIPQLISFMLDGGDSSRTISIKKTSKGVVVKTYRDIFCLSEVIYTKENFKKLLNASNIKLD